MVWVGGLYNQGFDTIFTGSLVFGINFRSGELMFICQGSCGGLHEHVFHRVEASGHVVGHAVIIHDSPEFIPVGRHNFKVGALK